MVSEEVSEEVAARFATIPGFEVLPSKAPVDPGQGGKVPGDTGKTGTVNYADMKVGDIQTLLEQDPALHERVLADETDARGDKARPGVVQAVEEAKKRLQQPGDEVKEPPQPTE